MLLNESLNNPHTTANLTWEAQSMNSREESMNNKSVEYGIQANGDVAFVYGRFSSLKQAKWYGDSEFGRLNYHIVIL